MNEEIISGLRLFANDDPNISVIRRSKENGHSFYPVM